MIAVKSSVQGRLTTATVFCSRAQTDPLQSALCARTLSLVPKSGLARCFGRFREFLPFQGRRQVNAGRVAWRPLGTARSRAIRPAAYHTGKHNPFSGDSASEQFARHLPHRYCVQLCMSFI